MKRFFDVIFALIGLIVLSPLFIMISVAIWQEDKDNIIFRQKRIGKKKKEFVMYKFRTMRKVSVQNGTGFEPGNLSRHTHVGKFLRRYKLDELPQLVNVLLGDMSFVGPRPEVKYWVDMHPEIWEKVLSVKPGITDNASILFQNEELLLSKSSDPEKTYKDIIQPKKLNLYLDYVDNHSFIGDLKIIIKTLFVFFSNKTN